MSAPEPAWWPTTWGRLDVCDHVQAPDGTVWEIDAIVRGCDAHADGFALARPDDPSVKAWTVRHPSNAVTAHRPPARRTTHDDTDVAIGMFRVAGFEVEAL